MNARNLIAPAVCLPVSNMYMMLRTRVFLPDIVLGGNFHLIECLERSASHTCGKVYKLGQCSADSLHSWTQQLSILQLLTSSLAN